MSSNTPSKPNKKQSPEKTFRSGAVGASVWLRQTATGFPYYDYSISRSYKSQNGNKEGYSSNFFHNNEEQLLEVISKASEWIRQQTITPSSGANGERHLSA